MARPSSTHPNPTARHYAGRDDAESQSSPAVVDGELERVIDELRPSGPALDLGTGVGGHLARIGAACDWVVGADVSITALRTAKSSAGRPVLATDGARMPFGSESFSFVVCTEVLEHVEDPGAVFAEIARVLKRDGVVFVTTPNYANLAGVHKLIADRRSGRSDWNPWGAHEGGHEAFMTGRRLWAAAEPYFDAVSIRALDYGQAITGRFAPLDRLAWTRPGKAVLRRVLPVLHDPKRSRLRWHGMHTELVLRKTGRP
jgi:2-polyprenyl-3-methyl-5-hydroxy-6-metoxy-1,4-benzoquinol methylase